MIRFFLAVVLLSSFFAIEPAQAKSVRGCEECPFPMHEWAGTWWNDSTGLKLEIKRIPGTARTVRVTLRDIETNRLVADGIGIAPMDSDTLRIELRRRDGVSFVTSFILQPKLRRVHAYIPAWIGSTLNGQDIPPSLYFND